MDGAGGREEGCVGGGGHLCISNFSIIKYDCE